MKLDYYDFFKRFLKLPEKKKIEVAKLLKQIPNQAKEHPKYFTAQVFAILKFIEGYREVLPKHIQEIADKIYKLVEVEIKEGK